MQSDSDDSDVDSDNSDSDDSDENDNELADKITKPKEQNVVMNSFQPNEIHHFTAGMSNSWRYSTFSYYLDQTQYLIANSDQVRVKYIV